MWPNTLFMFCRTGSSTGFGVLSGETTLHWLQGVWSFLVIAAVVVSTLRDMALRCKRVCTRLKYVPVTHAHDEEVCCVNTVDVFPVCNVNTSC